MGWVFVGVGGWVWCVCVGGGGGVIMSLCVTKAIRRRATVFCVCLSRCYF